MNDDVYEVFGLLYASLPRTRREAISGADPDDRTSMPVAYYVWVIRNAARTIVVDTGFEEEEGRRRGRAFTIAPEAALASIGVEPDRVTDVILTHLHFDHAGNLGSFPQARFHLQESEMAFATGWAMSHEEFRRAYSHADILNAVRLVFEGRMAFIDGDRELFPGVSVHLIGGHSKGLQCIRVATDSGPIVLASDTAHYYENLTTGRPFPVQHDIEASIRGFEQVVSLAGALRNVVPGHDLSLMEHYDPPDERLRGKVVRITARQATLQ